LRPCVFIHTNRRQRIGAIASSYSLERNSRHADRFDIRILQAEEFDFLKAREGQRFLRGNEKRVWEMDDLQSFTPLRFFPPELMGYEGRAIIMDPDIFAVGDIWELLDRDMQGKSIWARPRPGHNGNEKYMATSVMLLDCAKLRHWRCAEQFDELFSFKRDYLKWTQLQYEPRLSIGDLEPQWNDFDHLDQNTRLLHNTKRRTQPWKTGLPVDFTLRARLLGIVPADWLQRIVPIPAVTMYRPHPDPNQERFFFGLLRECMEKGIVGEDLIREEMAQNHLRHDALDLLRRTPPLAVA
jgi:hypothetical protein